MPNRMRSRASNYNFSCDPDGASLPVFTPLGLPARWPQTENIASSADDPQQRIDAPLPRVTLKMGGDRVRALVNKFQWVAAPVPVVNGWAMTVAPTSFNVIRQIIEELWRPVICCLAANFETPSTGSCWPFGDRRA